MYQKLVTLHDEIEAVLNAVSAELKPPVLVVKSRMRFVKATMINVTPQRRKAVMGDPTFYFEVLEIGPTTPAHTDGVGQVMTNRHRFRVQFWYAYDDDDGVYNGSSQERFDLLVEGVSQNTPGLLTYLRTIGYVATAGGATIKVYNPEQDRKDVVPLQGDLQVLAHTLSFQIELGEEL